MPLLDTLDGTFMNFAYGWSLSQPVRKVYYNLTITALSISSIDLNTVGFLIVGLLFLTWAISILVWRYARIEERWSGPLAERQAASESASP